MEKLLSIIIPVYNTEKYLAECLDSCLEQDIPAADYEIICVNDGSTDGSAAILDRYAQHHSSIRVLTQENQGVSAARNAGLDAALGKYIWFVDGDDFIQKNCLARLLTAVSQSSADLFGFSHYEFEEKLTPEVQAQADAGTLQPSTIVMAAVIWEALYRREFLDRHSLRFRVGISYAEDGLFLHELYRHSPVIEKHQDLLYFYRRNPGSVTRTFSPEALRRRTASTYQVARIMLDYLLEDQQMLRDTCADREAHIRVLMPQVRQITYFASNQPLPQRRELLGILAAHRLFPLFLYRRPRDWFPKKIHMNHAYMGLKGKVMDVAQFYSTTRPGFAALMLINKLRRKG